MSEGLNLVSESEKRKINDEFFEKTERKQVFGQRIEL